MTTPALAVLWHRFDDDTYSCVWLGDEQDVAAGIAEMDRPAMQPGEAVVCELSAVAVAFTASGPPLTQGHKREPEGDR